MRANKVKDLYNISEMKKYFNNNLSDRDKKVILEILPEFNSIYEYYKKISDVENKIIENEVKTEMKVKIDGIKNNKFIKSEEEKKRRISEVMKSYNSEKIIIHKGKLNMLEELVDEMAVEIIKEDMKKNNVTLPEFIKGMRYFKSEDEENIDNSEVAD